MDPLWLLMALILGLFAQQMRLPPMIGFLLAGFVLHTLGVEGNSVLQKFADVGVTLLLFTIGIKLRIRNLLAAEVWVSASAHMTLVILLACSFLLLPGVMGFAWFGTLDWQSATVIAFALSFSSTVFVVKTLEERGEMKSRHGQVAIGILIIQDLIAVGFLTLATDKSPTPWAIALLALPLARPLLNHFMNRSGHGEMLVLFGMFMAIGGGELFKLVGMKAGLGALIFGVLLSGQHKSTELSKVLLGYKDLFLTGFFLSIGISALPNSSDLLIAATLVLIFLPLKVLLYFLILTSLRLRAHTAYLSSTALANYSEFGLIVTAVGISENLIDNQWLVIIAMALTFSFAIGSVINSNANSLYATFEHYLRRFESSQRLPIDIAPDLGDAEILIAGMGRVGSGAYKSMHETFGNKVLGIDSDTDCIKHHEHSGYNIILGDIENTDFWQAVNIDNLRLIMLAMPTTSSMQQAIQLLNGAGYKGVIAAVAKHEDDRKKLKASGVHATFNFYAEAGAGFAEHVRRELEQNGHILVS